MRCESSDYLEGKLAIISLIEATRPRDVEKELLTCYEQNCAKRNHKHRTHKVKIFVHRFFTKEGPNVLPLGPELSVIV